MNTEPTPTQSLWHGLRLNCPRCGKGKLFSSYLKLNDTCSNCQESLSTIRADDGPAWLTILITGHIILPLVVYFETNRFFSYTTEIIGLLLGTIILSLLLLPRSKGFFIAVLWLTHKQRNLNQ